MMGWMKKKKNFFSINNNYFYNNFNYNNYVTKKEGRFLTPALNHSLTNQINSNQFPSEAAS